MNQEQYLPAQQLASQSLERNKLFIFALSATCITIYLSPDTQFLKFDQQVSAPLFGVAPLFVLLHVISPALVFSVYRYIEHENHYETIRSEMRTLKIEPIPLFRERKSQFYILVHYVIKYILPSLALLALVYKSGLYNVSLFINIAFFTLGMTVLFYDLIKYSAARVAFTLLFITFAVSIILAQYMGYVNLQRSAQFTNSTVSNANLRYMNIPNANFHKSIINNVSFDNSDIRKAYFTRAKISNADFAITNLFQASFSGTRLSNTEFFKANARETSWIGSQIENSHFFGAKLRSSDFSKAILEDVGFRGAKMQAITFFQTKMSNVDLRNTDLSQSYFESVDVEEVHFHGAVLTEARFKNMDLSGSLGLTQDQMSRACGKNVKLPSDMILPEC